MGTKTIPQLTLRSDFDEDCEFPVDDGTQTWKVNQAMVMAALKTALMPLYGAVVDADGGGSYETLQDAIAALPSGGVIKIASNLTIDEIVTLPDNTVLVGPGWGKKITLDGEGRIYFGAQCAAKDLYFYTEDDDSVVDQEVLKCTGNFNNFYHCKFEVPDDSTRECIEMASDGNHVAACVFKGVASPSTGVGINDGGADNTEADNIYLT